MKAEQALEVVNALGLSVCERERLADMLTGRTTKRKKYSPIREMLRNKKPVHPKPKQNNP